MDLKSIQKYFFKTPKLTVARFQTKFFTDKHETIPNK